MVVRNSCTPQRIYGPYTQTLFLGLSVQDFSCSVGWNEQFTTCTVNLVKDPCAGTRKVLNHNTLQLEEQNFPNGDPGFIFDNDVGVGTPVFLKVENFEFAGIVQTYTYQESSNGFTYTVSLISPGLLLESAQLILGKYTGPITLSDSPTLANIFNVYGFLESLGEDCGLLIAEDCSTFGSLAGGFGNAEKTERGIPWTLVKKAVQVLAGGLTSANPYSPYSALVFKAGVGQYGSIKNRYYLLDIEEVPLDTEISSSTGGGGAPTGPNPGGGDSASNSYRDYRIPADNMSILELLSSVCRDAGYEFYVDMLPTVDNGAIVDSGSDDKISNIIKIRTVERRNQPALGAISAFIQSQNANGNIVSQDSLGVELAQENNSAFLVGGQKHQVYQQLDGGYIRPYLGENVSAQFGAILANNPSLTPDYQWYFNFENSYPFPDANSLVNPPEAFVSLQSNIPETFFAMATADFTSWLKWVMRWYNWSYLGTYIWQTLKVRPDHRGDYLVPSEEGTVFPDLSSATANGSQISEGARRDLKTLYQYYQGIARPSLGTQFAVGIPWVCYDINTDTNKTIWSDEPASEGGWADALIGDSVDITINGEPLEVQCPTKTILGLDPSSVEADFFKTDDGRIQCFAAFSLMSGVNLTNLSANDYIIDPNGQYLWVKAELDPQWKLTKFYPNFTTLAASSFFNTYAAAIIRLAGPVTISPRSSVTPHGIAYSGNPITVTEELLGHLYNLRTGLYNPLLDKLQQQSESQPEGGNKVNAAPLPFLTPIGVAIPVKSNTQTYGPWSAVANVDGKVYYEQDDSLVPWEYGGMVYMNLAAQAKINNSICNVQTTERGSVTVAGYPEKSLGSDISTSPIPAIDRSSLLKLGSYSSPSNNFNFKYLDLGGPQINKGAQITNISVTVGNEITTQYSLSSFTPTFGRFSKNNAERLKQIGQQRYKISKALRSLSGRSQLLSAIKARTSLSAGDDIGKGAYSRSNSLMMAGKYVKVPTSLRKVPTGGGGESILLEPTYYHSGVFPTTNVNSPHLPLSTGVARKEVTNPTLSSLTKYKDYDNTAYMSWDGFFRPIMTYNTSATVNLPRENAPAQNWSKPSNKVISEAPAGPLNRAASSGVTRSSYIGYTGLAINNAYLRFIANPTGIGYLYEPATRSYLSQNIGHDIEFIGRSSAAIMSPTGELPEGTPPNDPNESPSFTSGLSSLAIQEAYFDGLQGYKDAYRFMALRGPLYIHGWGYDIMGKPVPNQWESNNPGTGTVLSPGYTPGPFKAYSGLHRTDYSGLSDYFYPGYLGDANTWPAGPVDLRWDRRRGVWTIPNDFRLYLANIYRPMPAFSGSSRAMVLNANDVYDQSGLQPDASGYKNVPWEVMVYNPYNFEVPAGYGMLYYSHESGQYWPIMGPCGCENPDPEGTGVGCCQPDSGFVDGLPCVSVDGVPQDGCNPPTGCDGVPKDCPAQECIYLWNPGTSTWELYQGCGYCGCPADSDPNVLGNIPPSPSAPQSLATLCVPCGESDVSF